MNAWLNQRFILSSQSNFVCHTLIMPVKTRNLRVDYRPFFPEVNQPPSPPSSNGEDGWFEVEKIVGHRDDRDIGCLVYMVKWKGYNEISRVPVWDLNCGELIEEYHRSLLRGDVVERYGFIDRRRPPSPDPIEIEPAPPTPPPMPEPTPPLQMIPSPPVLSPSPPSPCPEPSEMDTRPLTPPTMILSIPSATPPRPEPNMPEILTAPWFRIAPSGPSTPPPPLTPSPTATQAGPSTQPPISQVSAWTMEYGEVIHEFALDLLPQGHGRQNGVKKVSMRRRAYRTLRAYNHRKTMIERFQQLSFGHN